MVDPQNLDAVLVVIPVRNEADNLAGVIRAIQSYGLHRIRVIDNGSTDQSAEVAQAAGVAVVYEPIPGYGQACWRGLQQLPTDIDWILFCDGDGSDDFSQLPRFLQLRDRFDLILGDRRATVAGRAVLTPVQRFGNRLATLLIELGWNYRYCDLGPFRLIRRSALEQINMQDRGFGWTVEMQVRAVELKLRICELAVGYYPRQGGKSKISGTISGSIQAGAVILGTLGKLYWQRWRSSYPMVADSVPKRGSWQRLLHPGLSALLLLTGCLLVLPYGDFRQTESFIGFGFGIGIMGLGFALTWTMAQISAVWFWSVAILARLLLLPMYPGDDVWRYLWEGWIQTVGFSPYQVAPAATELIPYRTAWWPLINHPDVTAIYPPIAQLGFRLLSAINPAVWLFKVMFVVADLLICWLLSRRFGYVKTLLYAWNPLILYCFAGGAHYDSWFLLPLVGAGLIVDSPNPKQLPPTPISAQRMIGSAWLVGISIAIKWISLPMLGFLGWKAWRQRSSGFAALILLSGLLPLGLSALVFCQDVCPLIPTDSVFVSHGRSAELVPYLVSLLSNLLVNSVWQSTVQANWIYAIPLALSVLWLLPMRSCFRFMQSYFCILLMLSPVVHAWYFTWLMPFAVATSSFPIRWLSLSAFIYFVLPHRQALGHSDWYLLPYERIGLWLPLVLWSWVAVQNFYLDGFSANLRTFLSSRSSR